MLGIGRDPILCIFETAFVKRGLDRGERVVADERLVCCVVGVCAGVCQSIDVAVCRGVSDNALRGISIGSLFVLRPLGRLDIDRFLDGGTQVRSCDADILLVEGGFCRTRIVVLLDGDAQVGCHDAGVRILWPGGIICIIINMVRIDVRKLL